MSEQFLDKDLSTWDTFKRLWPRIAPFKSYLFIVIICLVINGASDTYLLSLIQPLLDDGFASNDRSFLFNLSFIVLGLFLVRGVSNYVSAYVLAWISGKIVMGIRQNLFMHFVYSPVSFFDQNSTGRLLSRITYDSEQVAASSANSLIVVVRESIYLAGLIFVMFYNSWQLSLVLLLIGPIVGILIGFISKRFRILSKNIQNSMGMVTTSAEQMLKGHKEVLIFGAQETEINAFQKVSNHIRRQGMKMVSISALSTPFIQLIASIALSFILIMASFHDVVDLTPGEFTAVFSAMIALMKPLKELTNVNAQFQKGMAACQTIFKLFDLPREKDEGTLVLDKADGEIEFRNVTFTYPTRETPALVNVSFKVAAGKTIALVGRSGSGKSTIASLLTRFYDVEQGEILIDGKNIKEYTLASLRNQIGLVSQNVHLFHDTIANNITYARAGQYTQAQIEKAAEHAYAMDFIKDMDQGLNTIVGENGVLLSGGQRQRVAIARALLRDNPILILDEATSALDTESERAIQSALTELQKDRTSIVIAHRLSTIENADEILVISDGTIVERGRHQELIGRNGAYAQLHQIQFSD
ncbi:lipid A export permease/ATP-binding protein MsbA [Orbus hercynius]|uniref:Lipid A export permease/ATP-binding protein MsbA n=1 Tax=Orbus hercynius TaxID=593135 RepID=A0A495RJY4_9GAMM|nr:lipid A ABC transporter ATP-binding protein/permease MsbA [Orbus hercynius]RKS87852.1 lipid A export permease/ATP-binding protein MsbA [Orbus hercynius]